MQYKKKATQQFDQQLALKDEDGNLLTETVSRWLKN